MKNIAFALACVSVSIVACSSKPSTVAETESSSLGDVHVVYTPLQETSKNSLLCPDDMKLVEGFWCPVVEEICDFDVDPKGNRLPGPHKTYGRCGQFKFPTRCLSDKRVYKKFCVDTFEIPNVEGAIPQSWMSWYDVKNFCESKGKHMLTASDWVFACEGEEMKPYPYKTGYIRDITSCDTDNPVPDFDRFKDTKQLRYMDRLLLPSGSKPDCISPFGVMDTVGSIDEFVINESGHPYKSALVGGHAIGVRNRCRTSPDELGIEGTVAHGPTFSWWETGGRCMKDVN